MIISSIKQLPNGILNLESLSDGTGKIKLSGLFSKGVRGRGKLKYRHVRVHYDFKPFD